MRIVFIDMHCTNFLNATYEQMYHKNKIVTFKHRYLVDYALSNNIEVINYITCENSNLCGIYKIYKKLCKVLNLKSCYLYEAKHVLNYNFGLNNKIINIFNANDIREDDIVICYLYSHYQLRIISKLNGKKVCFLNHFISINKKVNFDEYGISAIVNEVDLSNNSFFNKYCIYNNAKLIVCPYVYGDRFVNKSVSRKQKALGIGTLSTCEGHPDYKLYRKFFNTEWIQNQRKLILDNQKFLDGYVDSYISYIKEDQIKININDNILIKLFKKVVNKFIPWRQKKYTSFNMVDKFNEYDMFLCPEENADMPGIGYVEGIASGCVYIGLDKPYYRSVGLIPNYNYISYDGTLDDLKQKISYYRNHSSELENIRVKGYNYVRAFNSTENVAKNFFKEIMRL